MRNRVLLCGIVVGALAAASARPASAGLGLFGSYWDTDELGETAGVGLKFKGKGFLAFELRGTYFPDLSEDFNELIGEDDPALGDLELEAIPIDAGLTINFGSQQSFNPYAGAGVSYFLLDSNVGDVDDEVGYYLLAGFELGGKSGGVGFFAEALLREVEGTFSSDLEDLDDLLIDDEIDIELGGLGVNAGILWRF